MFATRNTKSGSCSHEPLPAESLSDGLLDTMTPSGDQMRALRLSDLARCVELSAEVGWNQNEGDWRFLVEQGFSYGIERLGKGLVATTVAWPLGGRFVWINMVIVRGDCRGQGLATRLLQKCWEDAEARGQVALLDATDAGAHVYSRMGFSGSERIVRLFRNCDLLQGERTEPLPLGWAVDLATGADLSALKKLDQQVVGVDRGALIEAWINREPSGAHVLRDRAGKVRGFLLGRGGRTARQLGPLVVESEPQGRMLMSRALQQQSGPLLIDVPENHLSWLGTLHHWGFKPQRRFRRMGQQAARLPTDWSRYFATAGPEFA